MLCGIFVRDVRSCAQAKKTALRYYNDLYA